MNMFIIETPKTFLSYNRIFVEFIELMETAASFYIHTADFMCKHDALDSIQKLTADKNYLNLFISK